MQDMEGRQQCERCEKRERFAGALIAFLKAHVALGGGETILEPFIEDAWPTKYLDVNWEGERVTLRLLDEPGQDEPREDDS